MIEWDYINRGSIKDRGKMGMELLFQYAMNNSEVVK